MDGPSLDRLMPMHLCLGATGRIARIGPTLGRVFSATLRGRPFFEMFEVRRPGGIATVADLHRHAGSRMTLAPRTPGAIDLRGLAVPLAGGGLIFNLSFGIGVLDAVRAHALTAADFAATDLAMELLYLVEAKSAVEAELRQLNLRLQGAKQTAEVQALTDTLTGLRNRRALDLTMADAVDGAQPIGVMNIDLDCFKAVNDTMGHAAGDHVLREAARILREETRMEDTVARVGGDEFVVVFAGLTDPAALTRIAERIVARLSEPFDYGGKPCRISASIGITVSTAYAAPTPDRLLSDADEALYASKHAGRGRAKMHSGAGMHESFTG